MRNSSSRRGVAAAAWLLGSLCLVGCGEAPGGAPADAGKVLRAPAWPDGLPDVPEPWTGEVPLDAVHLALPADGWLSIDGADAATLDGEEGPMAADRTLTSRLASARARRSGLAARTAVIDVEAFTRFGDVERLLTALADDQVGIPQVFFRVEGSQDRTRGYVPYLLPIVAPADAQPDPDERIRLTIHRRNLGAVNEYSRLQVMDNDVWTWKLPEANHADRRGVRLVRAAAPLQVLRGLAKQHAGEGRHGHVVLHEKGAERVVMEDFLLALSLLHAAGFTPNVAPREAGARLSREEGLAAQLEARLAAPGARIGLPWEGR